jgi:iodotyrosine deiodinase
MSDMAPQLLREPLKFERLPHAEQIARSRDLLAVMRKRRTVRDFSPEPVAAELIENAIMVAANAPSGANLQPWTFVVVSDPAVKRQIREGAEVEEREFYEHRAPQEWLDALAPLGTDWHKPFLETAPFLIVIFRQDWGLVRTSSQNTLPGAEHSPAKMKHYYATESVGIAAGMLITALHLSGLATLTHTPSPMGFLSEILHRPKNEKPFLLLPVGYPAADAQVPRIVKKSAEELIVHF